MNITELKGRLAAIEHLMFSERLVKPDDYMMREFFNNCNNEYLSMLRTAFESSFDGLGEKVFEHELWMLDDVMMRRKQEHDRLIGLSEERKEK